MYSTCLFCSEELGKNQVIESFPVGRRLAFDAARGRLWVVCKRCAQWNLSPLEERWDAIDDCERRFRATRLRVTTENIGLARLREGLELVRIGSPLRPEFAAWRYGSNFSRRRRNALIAAGAGAVAAAAAAPTVLPIMLPIAFATLMASPILQGPYFVVGSAYMAVKDYLQWERVVALVPNHKGRLLTVRAKHARSARLATDEASGDLTLSLPHDGGRQIFAGSSALRAAGVLLARSNRFGATPSRVQEAVQRIEKAGDAAGYFATTSRLARGDTRMMSRYRGVGTLNLSAVERLALEMAVHEEAERRALEGELEQLREAWRQAEEIAEIADSMFLPAPVDAIIRRRLRPQ
ncbi:MAG TPA: hypothetical protein VJ596_04025 [Gemmatimonadaceae bacterium]|nr:hypothetical protein [Gemmatimonadaceae bacterium]